MCAKSLGFNNSSINVRKKKRMLLRMMLMATIALVSEMYRIRKYSHSLTDLVVGEEAGSAASK